MTPEKDLSINFLGNTCENPFFLTPQGRSDFSTLADALSIGWGGAVCRLSGQVHDTAPDTIKRLKRDFPHKTLIMSITGDNDEEWQTRAKIAADHGADFIECAFPEHGSDFSEYPSAKHTIKQIARHTEIVCRAVSLPVLACIMPDRGYTGEHAIAAVRAGVKGITVACTVRSVRPGQKQMGIASISHSPYTAARQMALDTITDLKRNPEMKNIPITGMGGIVTWQDALDFLFTGVSIVQIMTAASEYGCRIIEDMTDGLSHYMAEKGIAQLSGLVGHPPANIVVADRKRNSHFAPEIDQSRCIGCGRCYITCRDSGHHAIDWDDYTRTPSVSERCVHCNLCLDICPIVGCITPRQTDLWTSGLSIPLIVPTD